MSKEMDPLWRMRHALIGMGLALLGSVFVAALAGRVLGDLFGDRYETRLTIYLVLLLYALVGAVLLFIRVAQHETQPASAGRVLRWLLSLWLWPALLLLGRRKPPAPPTAQTTMASPAPPPGPPPAQPPSDGP